MKAIPPEFAFRLRLGPPESLFFIGPTSWELQCPCGEVVPRTKRAQHFRAHIRQEATLERARLKKVAEERARHLARARKTTKGEG